MHSKHNQSGYILVLNLAVLTLLLVGAIYVGQRVTEAVRLAKAEQQNVDDMYQLESARAQMFFLLTTTPRSTFGIGISSARISLDGREYQMGNGVLVSLQDIRGLVSLNGVSLNSFGRERIERLVRTWGIADVKATALVDALLDYRDADDLRRLNGAEINEYRAIGGKSDLRNTDLLNIDELQRVYGWRAISELWGADPIISHVSVQRGSTFNPNTAGWRELVAMAGIDPTTAKSLVAGRARGEYPDISTLLFGPSVGDPFGISSFVTPFPGPAVVLTLRFPKALWGYRMVVTTTPGENTSPWRISSVNRVALPTHVLPLQDVPALPDFAAMRPAIQGGQIKLPP